MTAEHTKRPGKRTRSRTPRGFPAALIDPAPEWQLAGAAMGAPSATRALVEQWRSLMQSDRPVEDRAGWAFRAGDLTKWHSQAAAAIFRTALDLHQDRPGEGWGSDPEAVARRLEANGELEEAGGVAGISRALDAWTTCGHYPRALMVEVIARVLHRDVEKAKAATARQMEGTPEYVKALEEHAAAITALAEWSKQPGIAGYQLPEGFLDIGETDEQGAEVRPIRPGIVAKHADFTVPVSAGLPWWVSDGCLYRQVGSGDNAHAGMIERLPELVHHMVRRARSGRVTARSYVLRHPDGTTLHIRHKSLSEEDEWAGWPDPLMMEPRTRQARAYAVRQLAKALPEIDEHWGWHNGELVGPPDGFGPEGYGEVAPTGDAACRAAWREILTIGARHPKLALTVGCGLGGLFMEPMGRARFILALVSVLSSEGKSTGQYLSASTLGYAGPNPLDPQGVFWTLDAAPGGLTSRIGSFGCLPIHLDEAGAAGWTDEQWNTWAMRQASSGGARTRGTRNADEWSQGSRHESLVVISSNRENVSRAKNDGTTPRFVILRGPIIAPASDREAVKDARRLAALAASAYGHPFKPVRDGAVSLEHVRQLFAKVDTALDPLRPGAVGRIVLSVAVPVVGAYLLAELYGIPEFAEAALSAARDLLDEAEEDSQETTRTPGERFVELVQERIVARPAAWPTPEDLENERGRTLYDASGKPVELSPRPPLKDREGFRLDDGLLVLTESGKALMEDAGLSPLMVLRELKAKGLLEANSGEGHPFRYDKRIARVGRVRGYFLPKRGDSGDTLSSDEESTSSEPNNGCPRVRGDTPADIDAVPASAGTLHKAVTRENAGQAVSVPAVPAFLDNKGDDAKQQHAHARTIDAESEGHTAGADERDEAEEAEILARFDELPPAARAELGRRVRERGWPDLLTPAQRAMVARWLDELESPAAARPGPLRPSTGSRARAGSGPPRRRPGGRSVYFRATSDGTALYVPQRVEVAEPSLEGLAGKLWALAGERRPLLWLTKPAREALGLPAGINQAAEQLRAQGLEVEVATGARTLLLHRAGLKPIALHAVEWVGNFLPYPDDPERVLDNPAELYGALELFKRHLDSWDFVGSPAATLGNMVLSAPRRNPLAPAGPEPALEPAPGVTRWSIPGAEWHRLPEVAEHGPGWALVAYDRNGSYLSAWRGCVLPDGAWAEHEGPFALDVMSDSRRPSGYWLLELAPLREELERRRLPDVFARHGQEGRAVWVTSPLATLAAELAQRFGLPPVVVTRAVWAAEHHTYLGTVAERMARAYVALKADGSPHAIAALDAIKDGYSVRTMRFSQDHYGGRTEALERPCWRYTVTDRYAANTFRAAFVKAKGALAWHEIDTVLFLVQGVDAVPKGLNIGPAPGLWKAKGRPVRFEEALPALEAGGARAVLELMAAK